MASKPPAMLLCKGLTACATASERQAASHRCSVKQAHQDQLGFLAQSDQFAQCLLRLLE